MDRIIISIIFAISSIIVSVISGIIWHRLFFSGPYYMHPDNSYVLMLVYSIFTVLMAVFIACITSFPAWLFIRSAIETLIITIIAGFLFLLTVAIEFYKRE